MDFQTGSRSHARIGECRAWFLPAFPILQGAIYFICRHYSGYSHPADRKLVESKRIFKSRRSGCGVCLDICFVNWFSTFVISPDFRSGICDC